MGESDRLDGLGTADGNDGDAEAFGTDLCVVGLGAGEEGRGDAGAGAAALTEEVGCGLVDGLGVVAVEEVTFVEASGG